MKNFRILKVLNRIRPGGSEDGMALVIALMLMAMLSLLGASALLTTNTEIKISGNTQVGRTAFFTADGAGQASGGIIADCISDVGWPDSYNYGPGVTVNDGNFPFEAKNEDDDGDPTTDDRANLPPAVSPSLAADIMFDSPLSASVDVDQGPTVPVAGSSVVASAGYEGAGKGAAGGGMKTVYHLGVRGKYGERAMSLMFMSYDHYL
jgi:hypothetical protein